FETFHQPRHQTSNLSNNAPTAHSPLSHLNYTKQPKHPSLHITKPININQQYQLSKHFSTYLLPTAQLHTPANFIQSLPHITFVNPQNNLPFFKTRLHTLQNNLLFQKIQISQHPEKINKSLPLMIEAPNSQDPI
ncbi:malate:quinone oxidoreductase, partial [Staphylococcus capitis]|uniref:malate:quinone oxidoreductase n=1 Tax=Staphylococcus capitis TaxID=29388 RepID=UPI0016428E18